jgi:CheY-like chemotaxis protein
VPKKILVVDDNILLLQSMCEHLESRGYETLAAQNGAEAIQSCEDDPPDLIIMDLIMPVMSGIEATRILRHDPRFSKIPVIAFTSRSNRGQWDELFDDYLIKPFDYDTVINLIERFTPPLAGS